MSRSFLIRLNGVIMFAIKKTKGGIHVHFGGHFNYNFNITTRLHAKLKQLETAQNTHTHKTNIGTRRKSFLRVI